MRNRFFSLLLLTLIPTAAILAKSRSLASFQEKRFSVAVKDSELKDLLSLLAKTGEVDVVFGNEVKGKVTYQFQNTTIREAFEAIAKDNKLEFAIRGYTVYVAQIGPATPEGGQAAVAQNGDIRLIQIRYGKADDVLKKVTESMGTSTEKIIVDEKTNSLVYLGSETAYPKVKSLVSVFDTMQKQVMIDAMIVETSKNFIRDLGVSFGHTNSLTGGTGTTTTTTGSTDTVSTTPTSAVTSTGRYTALVNTPKPSGANFIFDYVIGTIDEKAVTAQLLAAEQTGKAKIVSRPKIVTVNNQAATINSGVTYNVKTLTANNGVAATGGVTGISAGLQVSVTPSVIDLDLVKLDMAINNSEPDLGVSVDGIPGVINNSANTSVFVKNGKTATIAGLVKKTKSNSNQGVPILKDIPVLGWFFQSHSNVDNNTELVIFITPTVLSSAIGATMTTQEMERSILDSSKVEEEFQRPLFDADPTASPLTTRQE